MGDSGAAGAVPAEAGQSAFAAIQEIVQILEADPKTDGPRSISRRCDATAIEMSNVNLNADARSEPVEGGMRFIVTGAGAVTKLHPPDG